MLKVLYVILKVKYYITAQRSNKCNVFVFNMHNRIYLYKNKIVNNYDNLYPLRYIVLRNVEADLRDRST